MNAIFGIAEESRSLFLQMGPYILFGFIFAGLLHIFVSVDYLARHLGRSTFGAVIKSVLIGIPLPLCSCGVIPAAVSLKKKGASNGAVMSFLIATPITGIDSILATYSLLGFFFAVYRVISSALAAIITGLIANIFLPGTSPAGSGPPQTHEHCHECGEGEENPPSGARSGIREFFRYTFVELFGDIWKWLVIGIVIGGAITYFVPPEFIDRHLNSGWLSMIVMLLIGIPMYICATGSIPIAAALMMKGLSPGAALVFLLTGPATNTVTITVVAREFGKKGAFIYIISIVVTSLVFGALLNYLWEGAPFLGHDHGKMLPAWVEFASAIVLTGLIIFSAAREIGKKWD